MSGWQDILMAIGAALGGGGFIKLLEAWLSRTKYRSEQDKQFRDELRGEAEDLRKQIIALKEELRLAEKELDEFKEKYWKLYMEYNEFKLAVYGILLQNGIDPKDIMPAKEQGNETA
jgi:hypothetical protein